nr:OTU domain-containing protein 7A [Oryctolagus cuniculus]XP_051700636.1 OTU domain-containing protein 7A [Oryctolagus cuniculus]
MAAAAAAARQGRNPARPTPVGARLRPGADTEAGASRGPRLSRVAMELRQCGRLRPRPGPGRAGRSRAFPGPLAPLGRGWGTAAASSPQSSRSALTSGGAPCRARRLLNPEGTRARRWPPCVPALAMLGKRHVP